MKEYRIVEETGKFTGSKSFYIQERRNKLLGGYKWVYKYQTPIRFKNLLEFDTLKQAKEWVGFHTKPQVVNWGKL